MKNRTTLTISFFRALLCNLFAGLGVIPVYAGATILDADFEAGLDGFTIDNCTQCDVGLAEGQWNRSNNCEAGQLGHSGDFTIRFGENLLACTYNQPLAVNLAVGTFTSPSVDLSDVNAPVLTFQYWFEDFIPKLGQTTINISASTDGENFTVLDTIGPESTTENNWRSRTVSLQAFAGQSNVQVRFAGSLLVDGNLTTETMPPNLGFNLDDVKITGNPNLLAEDYNDQTHPTGTSFFETEDCNSPAVIITDQCDLPPDNSFYAFFGGLTSCSEDDIGQYCNTSLIIPIPNIQDYPRLGVELLYRNTDNATPPDFSHIVTMYTCALGGSCGLEMSNFNDVLPPTGSNWEPAAVSGDNPAYGNASGGKIQISASNARVNGSSFAWDDLRVVGKPCPIPEPPLIAEPVPDTQNVPTEGISVSWTHDAQPEETGNCSPRFTAILQKEGDPGTRVDLCSDTTSTSCQTGPLDSETTYELVIWVDNDSFDVPSDVVRFTTVSKRPGAATAIPGGPDHCDTGVDVNLPEINFDGGAVRTNQVFFGGAATELFQIDVATQSANTVGEIGLTGVAGLTGLTFLPDGRLVGSANADDVYNDGQGYSVLLDINPATGAATEIGEISNTTLEGGVGRTPDLTYYEPRHELQGSSGFSTVERGLWKIDTTTGTGTEIGPHGPIVGNSGGGNALTWHPEDNKLYYYNTRNASGLYEINPDTGQASLLGFNFPNRLSAMAVEPRTNRFLASQITNSYSVLVQIDKDALTWESLGFFKRDGVSTNIFMDALTFGPDPADPIHYDVYFGTDPDQLSLIATGLTQPTVGLASVDPLQSCTRYYWRVRSYQTNYGETWSDVFKFTTAGPVTQEIIPLNGADNQRIPLTPVDLGNSDDVIVTIGPILDVSNGLVGDIQLESAGSGEARLTPNLIDSGSNIIQLVLLDGGKTIMTSDQPNHDPIPLRPIGDFGITLEEVLLTSDIYPSEPGMELVFEKPLLVALGSTEYAADGIWISVDATTLPSLDDWDQITLQTQNQCLRTFDRREVNPADYNNDGVTNGADFAIWRKALQDCPDGFASGASITLNGPVTPADPNICEILDLNEDGQTDGGDVGKFAGGWLDPNDPNPFGGKPYWNPNVPNIQLDPNLFIPPTFQLDPNDPNGIIIEFPRYSELTRVPPSPCTPKPLFCVDACPLWLNIKHIQSVANGTLNAYGEEFLYELVPPAESYCTELRVVSQIPNDPNGMQFITDTVDYSFCCDGNSIPQTFARVLGFDILTDCDDSITIKQSILCRRKDSAGSYRKLQDIDVTWSRSLTGEIKVKAVSVRNLGPGTTVTQTVSGSQQGPPCN